MVKRKGREIMSGLRSYELSTCKSKLAFPPSVRIENLKSMLDGYEPPCRTFSFLLFQLHILLASVQPHSFIMESSDIPGERKEQQAIASSENVDSVGSSISNSFNGAKVSTDVATFPVKGEAKKDEIFGKFVSEKDTSFEKVKEAITSKPTAKGKRRKQGDNVTNIEDIFLKVEKEGAVTPPTMEKAEPAQISKKEKEAGPKVMEKSDSDAIVEKAAITSSKTIEKSHPVTIAEKEGTIGLRAMKKLAPATIEEKEVVTSSKTIEESDPVSIVEKKVVTNSKMMEKSYPVAILGTKGGTSLETVKKHDLIAMEENEAAPISKTTSKPSPSATVAKVETTILKTLEEPGPAKTVENGWASGAKMMNEPEPGPIVESEGTTSSQMVENSDLAAIESTCASIKKTEPQKPDDATKVKSTAIADTAAGTVSIGKVSNSTSLNFLEHAPTAEVSDRDAIITAAAKKRQLSDCAKKEKDQEEEKESRGDSSPFPKAGTALMPKKLVIAYKSVKPKRVPVVRKMMAAKSVGQKRPTAITEPALSDNNTSEEAETKTSPATDEPKQSCVPKDAPQDPTSPSFSTKPTTTATTSTINTSVLPTLYRPRIHASKNVISGPTFRSASVLSTDGLKRRKRGKFYTHCHHSILVVVRV